MALVVVAILFAAAADFGNENDSKEHRQPQQLDTEQDRTASKTTPTTVVESCDDLAGEEPSLHGTVVLSSAVTCPKMKVRPGTAAPRSNTTLMLLLLGVHGRW